MGDIHYILKRFLRHKGLVLLAILLTVVSCFMELLMPLVMEEIINQGVVPGNLNAVRRGGGLLLLTSACLALAGFGAYLAGTVAGERFSRELREKLYRKIASLSIQQIEALGTGSLITRLNSDATACAALIDRALHLLLEPLLLLLGGVWMMRRISPTFDILFLFFALAQCAFVALFVYKSLPLFLDIQKKDDRLNGWLQSELRGLRLIKAYGGENREKGLFNAVSGEIRTLRLRIARITALFNPLVMLMANLCIVGLLHVSGVRIQQGGIQIGSVLAAVTYAQQILLSIVVSGQLFRELTGASAGAKRIREVFEMESQVTGGTEEIPRVLTLRGEALSFRFPGNQRDLFSGLELSLTQGAFVAVCGCAGCGKTTLARLLCRLYDPTSGRILVNGMDIRVFRLETLRCRIAVVEKNMEFFAGTVGENLRCGRQTLSEEKLGKALRAAGAEEIIARLPEGMASWALSLGSSLSGGERQRLALAKALAGEPDVLVMDDCTSSLDFETERRVIRSIRESYPQLAILLTTHRIFSVREADQILCINENGCVESGTMEELLQRNPLFSRLYHSQGGK